MKYLTCEFRRYHIVAITLIITLSVFWSGLDTVHAGVTLDASANELITIFGGGDSGAYLSAARDLVQNGRFTDESINVFYFWPPGMAWLEGTSWSIFGEYSVGVVIGATSSILLSLTYCTFLVMLKGKYYVPGLLFALFTISSTPIESYILDHGIFYAEGISLCLALLSIFALLSTINLQRSFIVVLSIGGLSGALMAAAAYFRTTYYPIRAVFAVLATFMFVKFMVTSIKNKRLDLFLLPKVASIFAAFVMMSALTIPWLDYREKIVPGGDREWTVSAFHFQRAWIDRDDPELPVWYSQAGPGVACTIDPQQCSEIEVKLGPLSSLSLSDLTVPTIKAIANNPMSFLSDRLTYISRGWFGSEIGGSDLGRDPEIMQGLIYLMAVFTTLYYSVYKALRKSGNELLLIVPLGLLALLAPFAIIHIEPRYLIPLKIWGLLAFTSASILELQRKRQKDVTFLESEH